jgi:DNA-binding winged helix-turn-helix (wHTH) protein
MGELGSADILEFGRFRFDRRGRCLYRLDKAGGLALLPAGRTALDILGLLAERPGEVVESEEIRRIVWRGKTVEDANRPHKFFICAKVSGVTGSRRYPDAAIALLDQ